MPRSLVQADGRVPPDGNVETDPHRTLPRRTSGRRCLLDDAVGYHRKRVGA